MFHGVINIYKEKGFTSHDVVAKLRGIFRQKKIGHTGTLDPEAVGVLPVCLGKGTKLCDMLTEKRKTYRAVLLLGLKTDTQDTTGAVLAENSTKDLTEPQVRTVIESFLGSYLQIPPMYSALKVNGQKLCDLARQGKEVERQARPVEIYELMIEKMELPRVTMTVTCSKGTYIRTLCHDIGEKLGCGGCMESLVRTRVERFAIEDSLTLSEVETLVSEGRAAEKIIPVDQMFSQYPEFHSSGGELDKLLANGNTFPHHLAVQTEAQRKEAALDGAFTLPETCSAVRRASGYPCWLRVYDSAGRFIGIYEYYADEEKWKPKKIFLGGD